MSWTTLVVNLRLGALDVGVVSGGSELGSDSVKALSSRMLMAHSSSGRKGNAPPSPPPAKEPPRTWGMERMLHDTSGRTAFEPVPAPKAVAKGGAPPSPPPERRLKAMLHDTSGRTAFEPVPAPASAPKDGATAQVVARPTPMLRMGHPSSGRAGVAPPLRPPATEPPTGFAPPPQPPAKDDGFPE